MADAPVFKSVSDVLADLPAIGKNSRAPQNMGGYNFRGIEDITAALKPLLAKHGVFMVPTVVERLESTRQTRVGGVMYVVDLLVRFTFCGTAGQGFQAEVWGQGTDSGDKATQKAMTSAFKSMLSITFCISDGDTDSERHFVDETVAPAPPPAGFDSHEAAQNATREVTELAKAAGIGNWIRDQGFEWPWSHAVCDAILAKVSEVSAQDERAEGQTASPIHPRESVGDASPTDRPIVPPAPAISPAKLADLNARFLALGKPLREECAQGALDAGLPRMDKSDPEQFKAWESLIRAYEVRLAEPFEKADA